MGSPRMKQPRVCIFLKVYCSLMLVFLGAAVALSVVMIFAPEWLIENETAYRKNPEGASALMAFFGVMFAFIFGLPMLPLFAAVTWPHGRSAWYVGLVAIIAGFFTSIGWIGTAPLLIFWMRPEVKHYYGLSTAGKDRSCQQ